jgi:methionyl-tRNA formyltransferase
MKLVFYLMNLRGYTVLSDFLKKYDTSSIEYVVTSRDEHVKEDYYDAIKKICFEKDVMVFDRTDYIPDFSGYKVAIGWRWLIRDTSKLIVMHDSILPKYRGFSPLVNMLIKGEKEIGVTALFASDHYDEGDIIDQRKIEIEYPIKINGAIDKVSALYSDLVISIFQELVDKRFLIGVPQDNEQATYSLWRDELDYQIDWSQDSSVIKRMVDALGFPFLGARSYLNDELITIIEVEEIKDVMIENRDYGKVIFVSNGFPIIVCGKGLIKIKDAFDKNNNTIIPLKKFRSRFEGAIRK